jgi:pimeloyl-ACP methyl ester carboxylesterase
MAIEHQRPVLGLLRSMKNRRHSGFAHGRSRAGLEIRRASHASIARTAASELPAVDNVQARPSSVILGDRQTPFRYGCSVRDLIGRLAGDYHMIAPDHLGFGYSDMPPVAEFDYTFDALADLTQGLLDQLGLTRYAIYVQDYGAPIGWRLALSRPHSISAIVTQNGNGYNEGFIESFWKAVWDYQREQTAETEAAIRTALDIESVKWQYLTGAPDESLVSPDAWTLYSALLSRPGRRPGLREGRTRRGNPSARRRPLLARDRRR